MSRRRPSGSGSLQSSQPPSQQSDHQPVVLKDQQSFHPGSSQERFGTSDGYLWWYGGSCRTPWALPQQSQRFTQQVGVLGAPNFARLLRASFPAYVAKIPETRSPPSGEDTRRVARSPRPSHPAPNLCPRPDWLSDGRGLIASVRKMSTASQEPLLWWYGGSCRPPWALPKHSQWFTQHVGIFGAPNFDRPLRASFRTFTRSERDLISVNRGLHLVQISSIKLQPFFRTTFL